MSRDILSPTMLRLLDNIAAGNAGDDAVTDLAVCLAVPRSTVVELVGFAEEVGLVRVGKDVALTALGRIALSVGRLEGKV